MSNDNVIPFVPPGLPKETPKKKETLSAADVEFVGFITHDDRDYYIDDPNDIARIFAFIVKAGIGVKREDHD